MPAWVPGEEAMPRKPVLAAGGYGDMQGDGMLSGGSSPGGLPGLGHRLFCS